MMTIRLGTFAILTVSSIAAAGCGREDTPIRSTVPVVAVRTAQASIQPLVDTFEAGGAIAAGTTATLSSRIAADIREVRVQPGNRVKKGQTLVVLDDRDLAAQRAQTQAAIAAADSGAAAAHAARDGADAALVLARENHRRIDALRAKNSATPQELDRAVAELRMAEAAAAGAASRQAEAVASMSASRAANRAAEVTATFAAITAPFDGVVTHRLIEPGGMAAPGVPLITLETTGAFRLEVQVDAARARSIDVGDAAVVALESSQGTETVTGQVVEVARAIDPASHAFLVKVQLPAGLSVRSGMFARTRFTTRERQALTVPAAAVVRRGQLSLVFVVDGGRRARMRAIVPGAESGGALEVLAGLQPGEAVVVSPPGSLADGAAVVTNGDRP